MPIEVIDLDKGKGNAIIGTGILTGKEYIYALKKHFAQDKEKFNEYKYSLADYTSVTKVEDVPTSDVQLSAYLSKQAAQINSDAIVSIVADKEILFGLSRMWEILMHKTSWNIRVFRTRDSAEKWIKAEVKKSFGLNDLSFFPNDS